MTLNLLALLIPMATATMTPGLNRGEKIVTLTGGKSEICVIPKKFPLGKYSKDDKGDEEQLCALGSTQPVAYCPKMVSTNPAVEFYTVPNGMTASQVEAKMCEVDAAKKFAKYKSSISCSYTPSILAYYHVSRIFGDILMVPPAVLHTFDIERQRQIAEKAISHLNGKSDSLLKQIWEGFNSHLRSPGASAKKDVLFTDDLKQSYGALQQNPRGEEKYSEMFFAARAGGTRAEAFRDRSPIYQLLKDSRSLRSLVGNQWNKQNVQTVQQMRDVSEMILMDYLLGQEDRFGNVHYKESYLYVDASKEGQSVEKMSAKSDAAEVRSRNAILVKRMMLKDNDCGVSGSRENRVKKYRLLEGVNHMNPETYKRLLALSREVSNASTTTFFREETMMTAGDYNTFRTNVAEAVEILQGACRRGKLQLDLDLNGHFVNRPIQQGCD